MAFKFGFVPAEEVELGLLLGIKSCFEGTESRPPIDFLCFSTGIARGTNPFAAKDYLISLGNIRVNSVLVERTKAELSTFLH